MNLLPGGRSSDNPWSHDEVGATPGRDGRALRCRNYCPRLALSACLRPMRLPARWYGDERHRGLNADFPVGASGCRRAIKMSPLYQLQMTLPWGFLEVSGRRFGGLAIGAAPARAGRVGGDVLAASARYAAPARQHFRRNLSRRESLAAQDKRDPQ